MDDGLKGGRRRRTSGEANTTVGRRSWLLRGTSLNSCCFSSNQTPAAQPQQTSWSQTLRTLQPWREMHSFLLVGVVWSVCMVELPLHPSLLPVDVWWRLLVVCTVWLALGGSVHVLKCCMGLRKNLGERPLRMQQDAVTEYRCHECSWRPQPRSPGHSLSLTHALADSLLLCVLQEPLSDPSMPHIKTLISRLEAVSHTLEEVPIGSEATLEELDRDSILTDKVKLIRNYLQQRTRSLCRLLQVQGDFDDSVKGILEGIDDLWAQLEELHTGVTLTKEGSRGHKDLASAHTDADTLFTVLGHSKTRLQSCQTHLERTTQLIQELTWSHNHISISVSSSCESVWPELLLQSNIEQFDKVQESFISLEQQTSTFQAHLKGLGKGNQKGHAGPLAQTKRAQSIPLFSSSLHLHNGQTSDVSLDHRKSTSSDTSVSSAEAQKDSSVSHREKSALQFSSTVGWLSKVGKRK